MREEAEFVFSANAESPCVHAHTIVLGAPPRADCRRVCAMNFRRRLYSHQPIAVNSLAHCRSNVLTSYESRTPCVPVCGAFVVWGVAMQCWYAQVYCRAVPNIELSERTAART